MKKTIAILLAAAAGIVTADTKPQLTIDNWDNTAADSYDFVSKTIAATVAVTLDLKTLLYNLKDDAPIFTLVGPHTGGNKNVTFGLGIDYAASQNGALYMDAWLTNGPNYSYLDLPLDKTEIKQASYGVVVFTLEQAAEGGQVLVNELLFLYNSQGEMLTQAAYPGIPGNNKYVAEYASFEKFYINTNLVKEVELYNSVLDDPSLYAVADNMIKTHLNGDSATDTTVPEPATATLSLLALAGLAARRRRR